MTVVSLDDERMARGDPAQLYRAAVAALEREPLATTARRIVLLRQVLRLRHQITERRAS